MKISTILFAILILFSFFSSNSCNKKNPDQELVQNLNQESIERDDNNGIGATTLGIKLTNPYSVNIVKQAYSNLYGQTIPGLLPTHLYVRFLPTSPQELSMLNVENQEYWDFPLDYKIIHMGERYHDPSVQDTNYTWLYTVVPYGAQFPQVQYEILEQIVQIPYESQLLKEAYRLTNNYWNEPDAYLTQPTFGNGVLTFIEPSDGGNSGGEERGGSCGCPVPDHIRKPSGCVTVWDNNFNNWNPVRHVEVITARDDLGLFFVRTDETDDKGCWAMSHKYHGKIRVWVKFKSDYCTVKTMTGALDLLGYSFARKAYKGSYNGPNFNNIEITFERNTAIGGVDCCNWLAATANNGLHESKDWCGSKGIPAPPNDLKILIAPWQDGSGATVMLNHMPGFTLTLAALGGPTVLAAFGIFDNPITGALSPIIVPWLVAFAPDIVLNINNSAHINSDQVKEVVYHECAGHASHWQSVSNAYWQGNILYIGAVVTLPPFNDGPYGDGTDTGSGRCAVIESWGYHVGMTLSDTHYGATSSNYGSQGVLFISGTTSSYIKALERYNPNLTSDIGRWIPIGIFNDLIDTANESTPVVDNTSGFTHSQLFSCIDVASIPALKDKIQVLPNNSQQSAVTSLFSSYGY